MNVFRRARRLGAVVATVAAFTLIVAIAPSTADESWNYSDKGPEVWAELFPECGGDAQTPIDLDTKVLHPDHDPHGPSWEGRKGRPLEGRLRINYEPKTSVEVFNNTHTIQVNIPEGAGQIRFGGETYELLQFHFHTPSEHTRDGELYPVELHLVHANDDGQLAVVGIFLEAGRANRVLAPIWADLPDVDDRRVIEVDDFRLRQLAPRQPRGITYMGSLTTPPCSEIVTWLVLDGVQQMSEGQIEAFETIFSGDKFPNGNARPLQPLN